MYAGPLCCSRISENHRDLSVILETLIISQVPLLSQDVIYYVLTQVDGRAGAFLLYYVFSGGKDQPAPVRQGGIGCQIGGDLKLISYSIAVIPPAVYDAPSLGIVGILGIAQRFVGRRGNRQCTISQPGASDCKSSL